MPVNVLPDMDEPKMKTLGKQLNRSRKSSIIYSDKLKDQLDIYNRSLDRAKKSLAGKYQINSIRLKKHLVQVRGTQKCLRRRREQTFYEDSDEFPFGVYEGEKLATYRREIENIIQDKHPKQRRQRKVDQFMRTGRITGRILDDEDARIQFETIMTRKHKEGLASSLLRREDPLGMTFLRDTLIHAPSPRAVASPRDLNSPRELLSNDSGSVFDGHITPASSPSKLTLPPIQAGKDFMKYSNKQSSKFSLPNLHIRRATKGTLITERPKPEYIERLSKRRATTFI